MTPVCLMFEQSMAEEKTKMYNLFISYVYGCL